MNDLSKIKILSRSSDLAVIQAKEVGDLLKKNDHNLKIEYLKKKTKGDNDLKTPLSEMPVQGVFTNDLREYLKNKKCDLVVHSWKDLPIELGAYTEIAGTPRRADQRDILFVNKNKIDKIIYNKEINIFCSSPRRIYNLKKFIPDYFPHECKKINFHNIRGNIPTRFKKFIESDIEGFIVAKAAIDRLINNQIPEFQDLKMQINKLISKCLWIILPLSQNPCSPGQGALGLEIRKDNEDLKKRIIAISENLDFLCVNKEREILKKYGGGCHQNIGVSFFPTFFGIMKSERGQIENGENFNKWEWINRPKSEKKNIKENEIFPNNLKDYNFFQREDISQSIKFLNSIEKHSIWVSRKSAVPKNVKFSDSNIVWASGLKTWKSLSSRGIWVNGSADGLGEDMNPNISSLSVNPWIKLTHNLSSESAIQNRLFTYQLIKKPINPEVFKKKYFFWMSFSAFSYAMEKNPSILDAYHACGPGNTYNQIKKIIKDKSKLQIYLSYEDWKKDILKEKDNDK